MQRYFMTEPYEVREHYEITGENYHHMIRVMRMEPTQQVYLVFSDRIALIAEITEVTEEAVRLKEISKEQGEKELPVNVTIACGFPKGDKLDLVIQKTTELGVHKFVAFPAKNSVVKWDHKKLVKKAERFKKIATEAAEQSHRQFAPDIVLLENKLELIDSFSAYDKILIAYEESAKTGEKVVSLKHWLKRKSGIRFCLFSGRKAVLLRKKSKRLKKMAESYADWVRGFYVQKQHLYML